VKSCHENAGRGRESFSGIGSVGTYKDCAKVNPMDFAINQSLGLVQCSVLNSQMRGHVSSGVACSVAWIKKALPSRPEEIVILVGSPGTLHFKTLESFESDSQQKSRPQIMNEDSGLIRSLNSNSQPRPRRETSRDPSEQLKPNVGSGGDEKAGGVLNARAAARVI
jgi:hypothetical protein